MTHGTGGEHGAKGGTLAAGRGERAVVVDGAGKAGLAGSRHGQQDRGGPGVNPDPRGSVHEARGGVGGGGGTMPASFASSQPRSCPRSEPCGARHTGQAGIDVPQLV